MSAVSLDQAVPASWAAKALQPRCTVQGHLDNQLLLTDGGELSFETVRILKAFPAGLTSSISATAFCPRRQSITLARWSNWCATGADSRQIVSARIAVVLFNLGGPDSPAAVRPFLFNLFNDAAIIGLPQPLRYLIADLAAAGGGGGRNLCAFRLIRRCWRKPGARHKHCSRHCATVALTPPPSSACATGIP